MSNNRSRTVGSVKKGGGSSPKQTPAKSEVSVKKNAAGQRFAERQARKQEALVQARRTRNRRFGLVSIALVVVIVAALVIVKVAGSGGGGGQANADVSSPPAGTPIPAATLSKISSVPLSTLAAAPTSGLITQIQPTTGPPLAADGKQELFFVGAEYCPHCAAERWALYIALSKFGTFEPNPGRIHSATADGNVPTLTFYGTDYSSPYFTFKPLEVYTNRPSGNGYTPLQTPTTAQLNLWQSVGGGTFPFLDFGGKQTLTGAQYSYAPMQNLSFDAVAAQVGNNSTTIGANINAGAYQLIKTICGSLSSSQPAAVCSAVGHG